MQKNNRNKWQGIDFVLALLLMGQGLSIAAEEQAQKEPLPADRTPAMEDKREPKKPLKAPPPFVPTEEISADNAVSFPTDI